MSWRRWRGRGCGSAEILWKLRRSKRHSVDRVTEREIYALSGWAHSDGSMGKSRTTAMNFTGRVRWTE